MKRSYNSISSNDDLGDVELFKTPRVQNLLHKIHQLEMENLKLKAEIEKKELSAKLDKRDLQLQLMKELADGKERTHTLELALARANGKLVEKKEQHEKLVKKARLRKKHKFPWLNPPNFWNIPEDLLLKITNYLDDEELFEARLVRRIFYGAYYEQRVTVETSTFNFARAVKLAKMGRVFKNLEYFCLHRGEIDSLTVANLNAFHFPSLKFLDVSWGDYENGDNYSESDDIPGNPNIRKVRITDSGAHWLNEERFPNLEELIWANDEDLEFMPGRLPKLRSIEFQCLVVDWDEITKDNFPALEKVVFHCEPIINDINEEELENFKAAVERLQCDGVNVRER